MRSKLVRTMRLNRRFFLVLVYFECFVSCSEDNTIGLDEGAGSNSPLRYPRLASAARTQPHFSPATTPFPCRRRRPQQERQPHQRRPYGDDDADSVHRLRPEDVRVVGAMGDSLVAANGALGESVFYTVFEYRGVSWCAGGEGTWRDYMTLPNILKEFNPDVKGYSVGTGEYFFRDSHMNVAFPVASTLDAMMQAKVLVKRMMNDKSIDFRKDWKVITIFFGANDICSLECFNKTIGSAPGYMNSLMKGLDYLQENLPRAFVNLIPVIDVTISVRVKRSLQCRMIHRLFCMCYHMNSDPVSHMAAMARSYQKAMEDIVNTGRYDRREDFTVVIQPFTKLFNLPKDPRRRLEEFIDISYITYDCFHFSQKGHALAANMLWNNMLEPVGNKSVRLLDHVLQKFNCPDESRPYFFTAKNSRRFYETGRQW